MTSTEGIDVGIVGEDDAGIVTMGIIIVTLNVVFVAVILGVILLAVKSPKELQRYAWSTVNWDVTAANYYRTDVNEEKKQQL